MKSFLRSGLFFVLCFTGQTAPLLAQSRVGAAAGANSSSNASGREGVSAPAKTLTPNLLPPQNYAILDLGGSSGADTRTLLAMDDNLNVAYGTVGNESDPPPNLTIKTFSAGQLSGSANYPGIVTTDGYMKVYTFLHLTPTGKVVGWVNEHDFVDGGLKYVGTHGFFGGAEERALPPCLEEFYPQDFESVGFYYPSHSVSEITAFSSGSCSFTFTTNALLQPDGSKFFSSAHYASVLNTGTKTVFFDQIIPAALVDSDRVKFVRGTNTVAYEQNNKGMALLGAASLSPADFWDGQQVVKSAGNGRYCRSLNDQGWLFTSNGPSAGDPDGGVWHAKVETKFSAMLAGGPWEHQLTQVRPLRLSNQNTADGAMHALTELQDAGRQEFVVWDGAPTAVPWTPASTAALVWRPRRVQLPSALNLSDSDPVALSSSGVIAAVADPDGDTGPTASHDALLLLPVDYQEAYPISGFDGLTQPPWLMVPEYGQNFARAFTPASGTLPIGFTVESDGSILAAADIVYPAVTNASPVTIGVSSINVGDGAKVALKVDESVCTGGELNVSVKPTGVTH